MIVTVLSGAGREAAWTATTLDFQPIAQRALAARASGLTDLQVVASAGASGFLLGVASATVPNTFAERHAGSFHRAAAIAASGSARHVPVSAAFVSARLRRGDRHDTEVRFRFFPLTARGLCGPS